MSSSPDLLGGFIGRIFGQKANKLPVELRRAHPKASAGTIAIGSHFQAEVFACRGLRHIEAQQARISRRRRSERSAPSLNGELPKTAGM